MKLKLPPPPPHPTPHTPPGKRVGAMVGKRVGAVVFNVVLVKFDADVVVVTAAEPEVALSQK